MGTRKERANPITVILDHCKHDDNDPEPDINIAGGQMLLILSHSLR